MPSQALERTLAAAQPTEPQPHPAWPTVAQPSKAQTQDDGPTLAEAMAFDRAIPVDARARAAVARESQRWSRRYVRPWLRPLSLLIVKLILLIKRLLPFNFRSHNGIDRLGIWCLRHLVSDDGVELLLRHFIIETQLLRFIATNNARAEAAPDLLPTRLAQLGGNAVMEHDRNVYRLLVALGKAKPAAIVTEPVNYGGLELPPIQLPRRRARAWRLDLETSLYLMNIAFCLLTTEDEYERAVNSFQFDASLMAYLAEITGDDVFHSFTPLRFRLWVSVDRDVAKEVYWHAIVHEYAHFRLCEHAVAAVAADRSERNVLAA